jgi:type VI secretion system secreted protein VgrG
LVKDLDSGEPLGRQPCRILRLDGTYENGFTDDNGFTHIVATTGAEALTIDLLSTSNKSSQPANVFSPVAAPSKFSKATSSITSPTSVKKRKEVAISRPQCWIEDHQAEISANSERYSDTTTLSGISRNYTRPIRYKIYIPLKSNGDIVVELRVKIVHAIDAISDLNDSMEKDPEKILQREKYKKSILEKVKV